MGSRPSVGPDEGGPEEAAPKVLFTVAYDAPWRSEAQFLTISSHPSKPRTREGERGSVQTWLLGGNG